MFLLSLINEVLEGCHDESHPSKRAQQFSPDLGNSRQSCPGASRADIKRSPGPKVGASAEASRSPQNAGNCKFLQNGGRQQQQNTANNQPRYAQDEMNLREVSSPRKQQPNSNQQGESKKAPANSESRQAPANAKEQARHQQQRPRRDESDTIIGKGFTAAMKRGVAAAKPTPMHEEMIPQKDGGFVATIQRGFEGFFGAKPTSKEEVLRKRGPVFANEYEAVPGDEIDQRVQFFARRLPDDVAACMKLFRNARGEYQINDETVNMEQRFRQNAQGQTDKEIFVSWTTEEGEKSDPEPLGLYMSHTANIAYEVSKGCNVINQVPEAARMSFREEIGTQLTDGSADARFTAMEVASRQAKIREEAAVEWRQKQNDKGAAEAAEETPPEEPKAHVPKAQELVASADAPESSIIDDALSAMGLVKDVGVLEQPRAPAPPPAAAPMNFATPTAQRVHNGMLTPTSGKSQAGTFYGASQAGTFCATSQAPFGASRQGASQAGTFYGASQSGTFYGASTPIAMASTMSAGYTGRAAPVQRQTLPVAGSMYAYGPAYAVPVR